MCIFVKKHKKELLFDLNRKTCHRQSKTVKPILLNKLVSSEETTLVENEKIVTNDKEIAKVLINLFQI